jgi:FkbM family methyltransferase
MNVTQGYLNTIFFCLKQGKLKGAFLQGLLPLIIRFDRYMDQFKFHLIKFVNQKNGREIIIEINNRYKMYLNLDDKGICSELGIHKTREVFSTDYFQNIITEDMIVIDIGANIGYYALLESQLASKGYVHAIEPVPNNYNLLMKNIGLNNCKNVSTYNFALGNVNGFSDMHISDKCNLSSFIKNPHGNFINTLHVPIFTLDYFIKSHLTHNPHFIRMDVEGFEYEILRGSSTTLQNVAPLIFCIEMHPTLMSQEKVVDFIKMMKDNGFDVKSIFIEAAYPSELKFIRSLNMLRDILVLPRIGYYGNGFDAFEQLMMHRHGAMVFFEKGMNK